MKKIYYMLTLILLMGLNQCGEREKNQSSNETPKLDNPYLTAYSGGYTIEVKGLGNTGDIELYVLADNGKAQWMHLATKGRSEPEIMSKKFGTWTASDSYIKVLIDGNSGTISEEYQMKNGVFYNKDIPDRYLKRTVK